MVYDDTPKHIKGTRGARFTPERAPKTCPLAGAGREVNNVPRSTFSVVLPWPPTVNSMYRGGRGNVYLKPEARKWYRAAIAAIHANAGYVQHRWHDGARLRVGVVLVPPTNRKCDIDNRIKPVHDALEKSGLIQNDNMIKAGEQILLGKLVGGAAAAYVYVEKLPDTFGDHMVALPSFNGRL